LESVVVEHHLQLSGPTNIAGGRENAPDLRPIEQRKKD
jgi:hypothetical protein